LGSVRGLPAAATTATASVRHGAPPFWCATLGLVANHAPTGGQRLTNEKGPARLAPSEAPQSMGSRYAECGSRPRGHARDRRQGELPTPVRGASRHALGGITPWLGENPEPR